MKVTRRTRRAARRLYRVCLLDGALSEDRARVVATELAGSRRRGAIPILSGFQRLVRLDRERHTALVRSAVPLPDVVRDKIRAGLARVYGAGIEMSFEQDPSLIGGVRIRVGSDVYDGSVRARLDAIAARL
jgi:F-type H+-transporting ATPase subunit delta